MMEWNGSGKGSEDGEKQVSFIEFLIHFSFTCNENIKLFLKSDDFLIRIKLTVSTFELILTGFRRRKSRIKILTAILEKTNYPKLCMSDIEKLFTMTFEGWNRNMFSM